MWNPHNAGVKLPKILLVISTHLTGEVNADFQGTDVLCVKEGSWCHNISNTGLVPCTRKDTPVITVPQNSELLIFSQSVIQKFLGPETVEWLEKSFDKGQGLTQNRLKLLDNSHEFILSTHSEIFCLFLFYLFISPLLSSIQINYFPQLQVVQSRFLVNKTWISLKLLPHLLLLLLLHLQLVSLLFVFSPFNSYFFSLLFSVDPLFSNDKQKIDVEWMRKVLPDTEYTESEIRDWTKNLLEC